MIRITKHQPLEAGGNDVIIETESYGLGDGGAFLEPNGVRFSLGNAGDYSVEMDAKALKFILPHLLKIAGRQHIYLNLHELVR